MENKRTASLNKFIQCALKHVKSDTGTALQCRLKAEKAEELLKKVTGKTKKICFFFL